MSDTTIRYRCITTGCGNLAMVDRIHCVGHRHRELSQS